MAGDVFLSFPALILFQSLYSELLSCLCDVSVMSLSPSILLSVSIHTVMRPFIFFRNGRNPL